MVSTKPWSDYKESDYTLEQWHNACIIHQHQGPPTSKSQCKLPIKTPGGAINVNGVHAAAAVLAGARGGVDATPHEKVDAASFLVRIYKKMDEKPPDSIVNVLGHSYLEHFGVKGMHWGIRKDRSSVKTSSDHRKVSELKKRRTPQLTNKQLKVVNERLNLEQNFRRLNPTRVQQGHAAAKSILAGIGTLSALVTLAQTPAGKAAIAAGKKAIKFKK